METLAETYAVDLQCSHDVAVAELHLWYWQLAAADIQPSSVKDAFILYIGDVFTLYEEAAANNGNTVCDFL